MTAIDWSKAPDEATHGRVTTAGVDFYMRSLGEWVYFNSRGMWERAYGTSEANCEERPQWPGKGLPPVGTLCEMQNALGIWRQVEIFAHFKGNVFGWDSGELVNYISNDPREFRPIRTSEQIAAEEREKAVRAAMKDTYTLGISDQSKRILIERLYDAGYRKFEIVDGEA